MMAPIREEVYLWAENREYVEAWADLRHSRPQSMGGVGYISVSEIYAYCQLTNTDDVDERKRILRRVMIIDKPFVKKANESKGT